MDETKIATNLLQAFGYINAKEEDVILIESKNSGGRLNYILIEFYKKYYQFNQIKVNGFWRWQIMEGV